MDGSTAAASNEIWTAVLRAATRDTSTAVKWGIWAFRSKHSDQGVSFDLEIFLACALSHGTLIYRTHDERKNIALEVISAIFWVRLDEVPLQNAETYAGTWYSGVFGIVDYEFEL